MPLSPCFYASFRRTIRQFDGLDTALNALIRLLNENAALQKTDSQDWSKSTPNDPAPLEQRGNRCQTFARHFGNVLN